MQKDKNQICSSCRAARKLQENHAENTVRNEKQLKEQGKQVKLICGRAHPHVTTATADRERKKLVSVCHVTTLRTQQSMLHFLLPLRCVRMSLCVCLCV